MELPNHIKHVQDLTFAEFMYLDREFGPITGDNFNDAFRNYCNAYRRYLKEKEDLYRCESDIKEDQQRLKQIRAYFDSKEDEYADKLLAMMDEEEEAMKQQAEEYDEENKEYNPECPFDSKPDDIFSVELSEK